MINISNAAKKRILAMMLGLGLASTAGITVNALHTEQPSQTSQSNQDPVAQVQSISDSSDDGANVYEKYGGCGLSCAGCSLKCF